MRLIKHNLILNQKIRINNIIIKQNIKNKRKIFDSLISE
jgi:hypothetical protein